MTAILIVASFLVLVIFCLRLKNKFIVPHDKAILAARKLERQGFTPILNFLGEHYKNETEVNKAVRDITDLLSALGLHNVKAKVSIKPTQIGLATSKGLFRKNLGEILKTAVAFRIPLEIDMESTEFREDTLDVFWELSFDHDVRIAIQAYLLESESDISRLIDTRKKVRLVKGAYGEADVLFVDDQMAWLAERLLVFGHDPAVATVRDKHLVARLERFSKKHNISSSQWAIQMLYGRARKLQKKLIKKSWRVEIYLPCGSFMQALPYLWRRLKELKGRD